VFRFNVKFNM